MQFNAKTKNGYVVNFDTQKRRKLTDEVVSRILSLREDGLSIRGIAKEVGTHYSNVYYTLKINGLTHINDSRPSKEWLTRSQCNYRYGMNNSMFDYVKSHYPEYHKKVGNTVYIHIDYINLYRYDKKAYRDRYDVSDNEYRYNMMYDIIQEHIEEALVEYNKLVS